MGDNECWYNQEAKGMRLKDYDFGNISEYRSNGLSISTNDRKYCEEEVSDTLRTLPSHLFDAQIEEAFWYFDKLYITLAA